MEDSKAANLFTHHQWMSADCERLATQVWESLKSEMLGKLTVKGRSWCLKVLSIVKHLTALKVLLTLTAIPTEAVKMPRFHPLPVLQMLQ